MCLRFPSKNFNSNSLTINYPIYSQFSNSFYGFVFVFVICCLNLDPDKGHTFTLVEIPPRSHFIYRFPQIIFFLQLFCWRNQVVYPEVFAWVWILQTVNQWDHLMCFFVPIFFGKLTARSNFVFYFFARLLLRCYMLWLASSTDHCPWNLLEVTKGWYFIILSSFIG